MDQSIIIGLDIAKTVFQVHGVDGSGQVVVRRRLRRSEMPGFLRKLPAALVGIEACGTAHYWARQVAACGHQVRLLAPGDVKPYVKRGRKNDAADAAAICEAVSRPHLRSVPVKSEDDQAVLAQHRVRELLVRQRTALICSLRSHMAEFGLIAARGKGGLASLRSRLDEAPIPPAAHEALTLIVAQIDDADAKIASLGKQIEARHRENTVSRRLAAIPGIGPLIASALVASVPDPKAFANGRQFSAWLGLVPRQNSTGGKQRLGRITKSGNRYLRRLLVIGATGLIRYQRKTIPGGTAWVRRLLANKPVRLVTVALANKMARIAWAVLARGESYRPAQA